MHYRPNMQNHAIKNYAENKLLGMIRTDIKLPCCCIFANSICNCMKIRTLEMSNRGYYLRHRPVIKEESRRTKVRPVFDASAHRKHEPSLNDCLEKGPNLLELIPDI